MPQVEPCANLPKTAVHVTIWWCEHHQAWLLTSSIDRQTAESDMASVVPYTAAEFGPFDDWVDVRAEATRALYRLMAALAS